LVLRKIIKLKRKFSITFVLEIKTVTGRVSDQGVVSQAQIDLIKIQNWFSTIRSANTEKPNFLAVSSQSPSIQLFGDVPSKGIFLREVYLSLYQKVIASTSHNVIIGNPGIGKTFFGYYLMHLLMNNNQSFVYEPLECEPFKLFFYDSSINTDKTKPVQIQVLPLGNFQLSALQCLYIVDGHKPNICHQNRIVLICSPRNEHFQILEKRNKTCIKWYVIVYYNFNQIFD